MTRSIPLSPDVSRETTAALEQHVELLRHWQRTHNLVSQSALNDLWDRHVCDSWRLWPIVQPLWRAGALVDLGSGAGFPGLVLAIVARHATDEASGTRGPTHLVESNGKKAAFLRHAARSLDLAVHVHAERIEAALPRLKRDGAVEVVTARALASLSDLLGLAAPLLISGATGVFPKGARFEVEVADARRYWEFDLEIVTDSAFQPQAEDSVSGGPVLVVRRLSVRAQGSDVTDG